MMMVSFGTSTSMETHGTSMKLMIQLLITSLMEMALTHTTLMKTTMSGDLELMGNHGIILLIIMDGTHILMDFIKLGNISITRKMSGDGTAMEMVGTLERMVRNTIKTPMMVSSTSTTLNHRSGTCGMMTPSNG
jgi:hypothetical protein